jgi:hypothetical protein
MKRALSRFAWRGRGSLLLRFSLLSPVALALIAVSVAAVLEHGLTHDALRQQADEVAVVMQGVFDRPLAATTRLTPPGVRARAPSERGSPRISSPPTRIWCVSKSETRPAASSTRTTPRRSAAPSPSTTTCAQPSPAIRP